MKIRGIVLSLLLLLVVPFSDAATSKQNQIRWLESHGEILLETVCDDFAYGSIDYRECRAASKRLFEERCKEYRDRREQARGERREALWREQDKYCSAASRFGVVY